MFSTPIGFFVHSETPKNAQSGFESSRGSAPALPLGTSRRLVVPRRGFEPPRNCFHKLLRPACLPISPPGRFFNNILRIILMTYFKYFKPALVFSCVQLGEWFWQRINQYFLNLNPLMNVYAGPAAKPQLKPHMSSSRGVPKIMTPDMFFRIHHS